MSFDDLTPSEARVVAALTKAPFGIGTVRAVAHRAGVAPSTAHRSLHQLIGRGLVVAPVEVVARGRAMHATVYHFNTDHPDWVEIAWRARKVPLPVPGEDVTEPAKRVPRRLWHLFWNTARSQLNDVEKHGGYIAKRLLSTRSFEGMAWGARHLPPEAWEQAALGREFDQHDRALALDLARDARRRMSKENTQNRTDSDDTA